MKQLLPCLFIIFSLTQIFAQEMETYHPKENIYLVGDRTFSLFYVTDSSVVVIDPINEEHAEHTLAEIRKVTDKPVSHVIYSHNHWDHISGGSVFQQKGVTILSHQKAYEQIAENEQVLLPDFTWNGDRHTLTVGSQQIEMFYYGKNHGSGLTTFRFPEYNALFVIDLVVPDRVLYSYLPDADPSRWVTSLEQIQALEFNEVYFSHLRPVGNREDITRMQQYFEDLYAAVERELEKGTPFFDIPHQVKLPAYNAWKNYEKWLPMNVWRILMEKSIGQ